MRDFWRHFENTLGSWMAIQEKFWVWPIIHCYEFSQTLPDQTDNFTILEYLEYLELGQFRIFCDVFFYVCIVLNPRINLMKWFVNRHWFYDSIFENDWQLMLNVDEWTMEKSSFIIAFKHLFKVNCEVTVLVGYKEIDCFQQKFLQI